MFTNYKHDLNKAARLADAKFTQPRNPVCRDSAEVIAALQYNYSRIIAITLSVITITRCVPACLPVHYCHRRVKAGKVEGSSYNQASVLEILQQTRHA